MPTRADFEAAIPRCPRRGVLREGKMHPNDRCLSALRNPTVAGTWCCPNHGVIYGTELQPIVTTGVAA